MRFYSLLFIMLISGLFLGCGGHNDLSVPIMPDSNNPSMEDRQSSGHVLWGMVQVHINPTGVNAADVEVVPLRGAMFNANVQQFLSPPMAPINLLTFEFLPESNFPSGYVKANVGIAHPFVGISRFRGFDVRCIFMADAETYGEYDSEILYTKPMPNGLPASSAYLINPDGYTRWWNCPEFTDPVPIFSYQPSALGIDPEPTATLNPYKYFADELGSEDPVSGLIVEERGNFTPNGNANYRAFEIQFPTDPLNFQFNLAVDASWALPDPAFDPLYPVESFPPEAQTQEPFLIEGLQTGGNAFYTDSASGGTIELAVTVYDWQAYETQSGVQEEITSIWLEGEPLAYPVDILPFAIAETGPNAVSSTYTAELDNSLLSITGAGEFIFLGTVESADPSTYMPQIDGGEMFIYPDEILSAYFMMTVEVTGEPQEFTVEIPNGGEIWSVGSNHLITWSGGESIDTVTIEYSKDDFVSDINLIIDSVENNSSYFWENIPNDISDTVKVRISSSDFPDIYDESDEYFSITNELNEMIVYSARGPADTEQVYSIDPEGIGPPVQWTDAAPAFIEGAKLSPCGAYIIYMFGDMAVGELRIIDIATGVETNITPAGKQSMHGDFSHDGTKIVSAVGDVWYGPFDLWTFNYDGSDAVQLTTGADVWEPEYSFDDSMIIYQKFWDPTDVHFYDVATGEITQYTDNGTWNDSPAGSPDGTQIAWATMYNTSCRKIWISPVDSWNPPDKIIDFNNCVRAPCFSPDGTKMVVDYGSYDGIELAIYDLTDDTWISITSNAWTDHQPDWGVMIPY